MNKSTTPEKEKDLAQTPQWFVASLERLIGQPFDLDVCCLQKTAKARCHYSINDGNDGLSLPWNSGFNFCNPPFSKIAPWIEKAAAEAGSRSATTAMIIPAKIETGYYRLAHSYASDIIKMPFRLNFLRPDGTPFLTKNGKPQGPEFSCVVALFNRIGLLAPTRTWYYDFREGFYKNY